MGVWPLEITPCAEMKYSRRLVVVVIPGCIGQPTPRRTYAHLFPPPPHLRFNLSVLFTTW